MDSNEEDLSGEGKGSVVGEQAISTMGRSGVNQYLAAWNSGEDGDSSEKGEAKSEGSSPGSEWLGASSTGKRETNGDKK